MYSESKAAVELDVWEWIKNYIEVNNKFYDYKFPVCPYAKAARQKGIVDVLAYTGGNVKEFITNSIISLIADPKLEIRVIAMPPRLRWTWGIRRLIDQINREVITQGYYVQYGTAVKTNSIYPGLFNSGRYFVVLVNKLEPVLEGHRALLKTDYYTPWSKQHYDAVVTRRQKLYDKYKDGNKSRCPFHRFKL
jgi:hypothetical protein